MLSIKLVANEDAIGPHPCPSPVERGESHREWKLLCAFVAKVNDLSTRDGFQQGSL
jgi:hypothetical protein